MKKIILFLLLAICITNMVFSEEYDEYTEDKGAGSDLFLIFGTILVVAGLIYLLRRVTDKMKTDKSNRE
jgi:NAD-dependent SIR2 family protein deacetylase